MLPEGLNDGAVDDEKPSRRIVPTAGADYGAPGTTAVTDAAVRAEEALVTAEEAEAQAAAAEAAAAAARARARAIRLRRQAAAATGGPTAGESALPAATLDAAGASSVADAPSGLGSSSATMAETRGSGRRALWARLARGRTRRAIVKVAASVLGTLCVLGLLGISAMMYIHHRNVAAQQRLSDEYAAAARQGVVTLMSLDPAKAKEDVQRIIDNATGDFKKEFESHADEFVEMSQASKVITEATVEALAVQRAARDDALVMVVVGTEVTNVETKKQDRRSWRLLVTMARDGDRLKLSKINFSP